MGSFGVVEAGNGTGSFGVVETDSSIPDGTSGKFVDGAGPAAGGDLLSPVFLKGLISSRGCSSCSATAGWLLWPGRGDRLKPAFLKGFVMPSIFSNSAAGLKLLRGVSVPIGRLAGDLDILLGFDAIPPPTDRALVGVRVIVSSLPFKDDPGANRSASLVTLRPLSPRGVFHRALSKTSCTLPLLGDLRASGPVEVALAINCGLWRAKLAFVGEANDG